MKNRMPRLLAGSLALVLAVTGCTFPVITPAPGVTEEPVEVGGVEVSSQPGPAVDRPTLPEPNVNPEGFAAAPAGDGLSGYLSQDLAWAGCSADLECAEILVPLDYADPAAQAITLSLARRPATAQPRLGTLFVNPGGPGAAGTGLAAAFAREGLEQYDIVGWDPRGTGNSTPVRCYGAASTDELEALDMSPDDSAERAALVKGTYDFARSCWENSGRLLEHISTIETVRDLDLMRQLAGDQKLNYFGYSYGTEIGATYAELFPFNTGRLVLDAAVNITDSDEVIQAMGFDLALGNFATWCVENSCGLGGTADEVLASITGLFDDLDAAPLDVKGRRLTQSLAVEGVAQLLYGGKEAWPAIAAYVGWARQGSGEALLWAADQLNARDERGDYSAMFYAFPAISCLDTADEGVVDADLTWSEDQSKAPIFGRYFGPQYTCALWPVRPAPDLDLRGAGAEPILVIGGTGDNATPYQQAVTMADQLESGVLLTYQGEGHGSYGSKSDCVNSVVIAYLVNATLPTDGFTCT
ncbi:MAG: alpha/beta hydrolase [Propionicimonas sp.]|nr:alpha/beta hydrolase [Propionicimonas sp.]